MGEPIQKSEVGEPMVTVTMHVRLSDARRMAPLLYNAAIFSADPAGHQGPTFGVREGSIVLVEANNVSRAAQCRVKRCSESGLYLVGTEDDAEVTLVVQR